MAARLLLIHSPLVGSGSWRPVAASFAADGYAIAIPDLTRILPEGPPYQTCLSQAIADSAASQPAILIGHSRAGPLLAAAGTLLGKAVRGYIFVDARLPTSGRSWMETTAPEMASRLKDMARPDGWLPPWPEWWGGGEALARLLPDPVVRQEFADECPRLPLTMLNENYPPAPGWPNAPCCYLQLSTEYEGEADRARQLGWTVKQHLSNHLALLSEPGPVHESLRELLTRLE